MGVVTVSTRLSSGLRALHCSANALLNRVLILSISFCIVFSMYSPTFCERVVTVGSNCEAEPLAVLLACFRSDTRAMRAFARFCGVVVLYFWINNVSVFRMVWCMMFDSSFKHPSFRSILWASVSDSLALAFFFSSIVACSEMLACSVVALTPWDLVVRNFLGGVHPTAPVGSMPLEDIHLGFLWVWLLIVLSKSHRFLRNKKM